MKRTIKNIIMILIIVAMGVCSYFTMKDVKETQTSNMNQPTGMQQGGAPGGQNNNNGGYIEADNVNIRTQGGSCATLATDRGEGTVIEKTQP